jgi:hypothetical protein
MTGCVKAIPGVLPIRHDIGASPALIQPSRHRCFTCIRQQRWGCHPAVMQSVQVTG